jgi:hypothetical protein
MSKSEYIKIGNISLFTAPSGRYTPLKLINGKKKNRNLAKEDEDLDDKEVNGPDDDWSKLMVHGIIANGESNPDDSVHFLQGSDAEML